MPVSAVSFTLTIVTPSRISFSLLDMNGEIGRVDGGLGLTLEEPNFTIRASIASDLQLESAKPVAKAITDRAASMVALFKDRFRTDGIRLFIESAVPEHSGLGSGTQLGMAVGRAMSELYGLSISNLELAKLAGRGGTSGIGVASFDAGGFIVDGGHRFGVPEGKQSFAPSSASAGLPVAPVLFRHPFPAQWGVMIVIPAVSKHVHSSEERERFARICPLPRGEVEKLAHITLMKVMPAVVEGDLENFGAGIEAIQTLGFKRHEILNQTDSVRQTIAELRGLRMRGVGMSSWGPAVFGFAAPNQLLELRSPVETFLTRIGGGSVLLTKANNDGVRVIRH